MSAKGILWRTATLCLCFIVTAGVLARASMAEPTPTRTSFAQLPYRIGQFQGRHAGDLDQKVLDVLGVEEYVNRVYRSSASNLPVGFYLGYWASQRQGDAIHSPMNCLPGAGWVPGDYAQIPIEAAGRRIEVNRYVIRKGEDRQIALYWYEGRGRAVANEYESRALLVWDALRRNRSDGALVRITSPVAKGQSVDDAERQAVAFGAQLLPQLSRHIPE
jgi:EpsI family protein